MSRTKVLAVISRKGGSGKTTLSVHLAVAAERLGLVTAILDVDPQANSTTWGDRRKERGEKEPAVVPAQSSRLKMLIQAARDQEADLIILDTPPNADTTSTAAAQNADFILIPVQTSKLDYEAIPATVMLAKASLKPFYAVLNGAPSQGDEIAEAIKELGKAGVRIAPTVLHWRKAFKRGWDESKTAQEVEPDGKASAEVLELMLWVCDQLGFTVPPSAQGGPARKTA